jgi:hypothetical protein
MGQGDNDERPVYRCERCAFRTENVLERQAHNDFCTGPITVRIHHGERRAVEHLRFLLERSNPGVSTGFPKLQPTDVELECARLLSRLEGK